MESVYNAASKALFCGPNSATTDNERPSHETNPFHQTTENDNNPFHHSDTASTTKPYDSSSAGFGPQHTAGSGVKPNKPVTTGFGTGTSYDSGAVNPSTGVASASRSYDEPSSSVFDKPSTASTYGQHASDYSNTPSSNFDKPITTTNTFTKNSVGDLNKDGTRHEASDDYLNRNTRDPDHSPTISSIHKDSSDKPFASRFSEDTTTSPSPSTNLPHDNRDEQHRLDLHHKSGATAQGSNIQSLVSPNPATTTSNASTTAKPTSAYNPSSTTGASTHGTTTSGVGTANATLNPVTGVSGSGPGTAVDPSVGAHPTHTQQQTLKQQGTDRPLEEPSSEGAHKTPDKEEEEDKDSKSKGTGELYEKSTGVAADGGNFDASRPGAGREAERLLDQGGIHHGADLKPDVSNITTGDSKLFPGHKDKSAGKPAHDKHSGYHATGKNATMDHHDAAVESGHKGLGVKIKEKLHIGHQ